MISAIDRRDDDACEPLAFNEGVDADVALSIVSLICVAVAK